MKNINNESLGDALLDAIGDIGDDLVAEAAIIKTKTPMLYRKLWITAAVLICTLALFGGALRMGKNRITPPPDISGITSETDTVETESAVTTVTETAVTGTEIVSGVLTEDEPTSAAVTEDEPTEAATEPEPTTAAVTEPEPTEAATEPEPTTAAVTEPEPTEAATEPEPTTAAVTDPPSIPNNPQDTIAGIIDPPSKPNDPPNTTPGVIDPPSTTAPTRPPETTIVPTKPIVPPEVRPEDYVTVKGPRIDTSGISTGVEDNFSSVMGAPPDVQFKLDSYTFAVKASVVKNLPDIYYVYNEYSFFPTEYRVILMKNEDTLYGKDVPEYFYYAIESGLYVDMSVYDFLFISMSQLGTDGLVMVNGSDLHLESFPLPVFYSYLPEFGNVIPFTNGIFDESLWQTTSWINGYQFAKDRLDRPDDYYSPFMVKRGCTAEYTLEHIKTETHAYEPIVITLADLISIDSDSISYVTDFKNGTFRQFFNIYNKTVTFQRFLYGCETDEVLKFDTNKKTCSWSETRYSTNELAGLPNIAKHIEELETEYSISKPNPPHVSPGDVPLRGLTIFGYYIKHEGKLYGVVKTSWVYIDWNYETDLETSYTDEAFVLFENGIPRDISREELLTFKPFFPIYKGDYSAQVNHIIHE